MATDFNLKLSDEDRTALGNQLGFEFQRSIDAMAGLRAKWQLCRDQYAGVKDPDIQKADWQARYSMSLTAEAVDTAAVNICKVMFAADPYFELEAEDPEYDDVAAHEEAYQQFWHERMRLKSKVELAVKDALIVGQAWLRGGVRATGNSLPIELTRPLRISELDAVPECSVVYSEDMILMPVTAPNFRASRGAFAKATLRWNDFAQARETKAFYEDAISRVESMYSSDYSTTQIQDQQGVTREQPENKWDAEFVCYEGIYRWTKPGDKTETEWLILAYWSEDHPGEAIILRCTPYEPWYGSQWFYTPIIVDPEPNSMWGGSMVDDIKDPQRWTDATFEQSTDALTMAIHPPLVVPPSAGTDTKKLQWGPGEKWPLANPQAVQMLSVPGTVLSAINISMAQMESVRQNAQRRTGTGDTMQGAQTQGNKTAYEIGAVVQNANQIFEAKLSHVQIGMEEDQGLEAFAQLMLTIHDRLMPNSQIIYRTGKGSDPFQTVDPMWHKGRYRVRAHGNTSSANPQERLARATAIKKASMESPFLRVSPIDTPALLTEKMKRWYAVERDVFQALGVKYVESYIGTEPADFKEALHVAAIINPEAVKQMALLAQQNQAAATGGMVPPVPGQGVAPNEGAPVARADGGAQGLGIGGGAVSDSGIPAGMG